MTGQALVIDRVSKSFADLKAVDDLSAVLPRGSIYGFLGPNGAGKTTTIRMIMGIFHPDRGRIEVLGESSIGRARERIGYMPEERGLYRKMTVRGVISYLGGLKGMKKGEISQASARWLAEMDLGEWAEKKVEELSRGMQQKLQFIVSAINEPDLLILDEPFSGLDPLNLDLLKEIMLRLRAAGKTVIFSTHMMEQAEKLCDFILLINKGRKIIDGSLDEIRAEYKSNAVIVELENGGELPAGLPMVAGVKKTGRKLEVTLKEGVDSQEFLASLVPSAKIRSFEIKVPSLHEVFIHLVGQRQ